MEKYRVQTFDSVWSINILETFYIMATSAEEARKIAEQRTGGGFMEIMKVA